MDVRKDEGDTPRNKEIGEVHSTDLTDESTNDTAHDAQEDEEPEVEHLDTYSIINEEEDDDKLVGYLRAMHPIEELKEPDDEHVVQCYSMQLHYEEDSPWDATSGLALVPSAVEGTPPPGPEDTQSDDAQDLQLHRTWGPSYSIVHWDGCIVCSAYMHHLSEALWNHVPLAEDAVQQPELHARREYNRGWSNCDQAQMQCDWTSARASTPHTVHARSSPHPMTSRWGVTGQALPIDVGTQVPEPDLNTIWVDSPPTMVAEDEGRDNSFESGLWRVAEGIRLANARGTGRSPRTSGSTSILGEIRPQALTETNVLHYEDDTVIII